MSVARSAAMLTTAVLVLAVGIPAAGADPANARLTNDNGGGYVSDYTLVTGQPYADPVLTACSQSRGRQNERLLRRVRVERVVHRTG